MEQSNHFPDSSFLGVDNVLRIIFFSMVLTDWNQSSSSGSKRREYGNV